MGSRGEGQYYLVTASDVEAAKQKVQAGECKATAAGIGVCGKEAERLLLNWVKVNGQPIKLQESEAIDEVNNDARKFKKGDEVGWDMLDGDVMAGTVTSVSAQSGFNTIEVKRVDGGMLVFGRADKDEPKLRKATPADWKAAQAFYSKAGFSKRLGRNEHAETQEPPKRMAGVEFMHRLNEGLLVVRSLRPKLTESNASPWSQLAAKGV